MQRLAVRVARRTTCPLPFPLYSRPFSSTTPIPFTSFPRPRISPLPSKGPKRTRSVWYKERYHNPWPSFTEKSVFQRLKDLTRYFAEQRETRRDPFSPLSYTDRTFPSPYNVERIDPDVHLPLHTPDFSLVHSLPRPTPSSPPPITYTWLGHATSVIQLPALTLLTDPWFSQRASAWQAVGPRRYRPPACPITSLPPLDIILLTHNHFDHLDYGSVKALHLRVAAQEKATGRKCRWFVPLGMKRFLLRWVKVRDRDCQEMDWWQVYRGVDSKGAPYKVTAVGAQHWTSRWALLDNRKQLWCGYVVESEGRVLYYSGDSGYCPVFNEIGAAFPPPDLSLIPIGAYEPQWLLEGAHCSPEQAVQIHCDTRSQQSVGVHWGTVVLSREMVMEPKCRLEAEVARRGLKAEAFITTAHGETVVIGRNPQE